MAKAVSEGVRDETLNNTYFEERANNILEVVMSYARMEFHHKTSVTEPGDVFDAIGAGVNMLGEELENSTVSLKEKEQLLKEVHHRVKNNLQIISSLLNLQSENIVDETFLGLIRESKNRISSMALIHEMLYASKDLSKVKIKDYITKLSQSVYRSFYTVKHNVLFNYEIDEDLHFEIDRMIPIGLILNEIISNSLKYAFPQKEGTVAISLHKNGNEYTLQAGDNGVGFSDDFDYMNSKSLGMQLIHMLSEQLGGKVKVSNKNGIRYTLTFH
jgi:two-component sensor histidine kinase